MKIIITESKLYQAVIDYLNERYDINNIHRTYGLDDWGNEVDYAMAFYEGDYEDDDNLFMWYDVDYWKSDEMDHQDEENLKKWIEESPILSFNDYTTFNILNGYFGNRWHQPFKDWFMEHFKLPIKTIE
jgi:hypothetical protein